MYPRVKNLLKGTTKMKEVSVLMGYRPSIKVVDATMRDGGLVNNFRDTATSALTGEVEVLCDQWIE